MRWFALVAGMMCGAVAFGQQPWQSGEFPIACWRGPDAKHNTLEHYQRLRDCNFTIAGPTSGYTREQTKVLLDLCAKVGLKAIVTDTRLSPRMVMDEHWQDSVVQVVADYGQHAALCGYYLQDEPSSLLFGALGEISREFERLDPDCLPYINLLPTYANSRQLGTPTYAEHVSRFLRVATPRLLSYDHYALRKTGGTRPDYYENMELMQAASRRSGISWWYVHHSGAYRSYREPTEAEMRWQVYTSLAYGAKGISYWYYWGRKQEGEERTGVVDPDGNPTRLYHILQKLNAQTRVLGSILLPLAWQGVWHTGEIPPGTRRLGGDGVVQLPADLPLMVGLFGAGDGTTYALVANRNCAEKQELQATFLPHVVGVERVSPDDGSVQALALEKGEASLSLEPGCGVLLRLKTAFKYPEAPEILTQIRFQFDRAGDMEGWGGQAALGEGRVVDGTLTMALGDRDPHFSRSYLRIPANAHRALRVRMRVTGGDPQAQVFWTTSEEPAFSATRHMNFAIIPDGSWQEYEIPLAKHDQWAGKEIRALRLDPSVGGAPPGSVVEIDWIVGVPGK